VHFAATIMTKEKAKFWMRKNLLSYYAGWLLLIELSSHGYFWTKTEDAFADGKYLSPASK